MKTQTKTRSCTEKRRYRTQNAAQGAVRRFVEQGASPGAMHAYSCRRRGGWHIGHLGRRAR